MLLKDIPGLALKVEKELTTLRDGEEVEAVAAVFLPPEKPDTESQLDPPPSIVERAAPTDRGNGACDVKEEEACRVLKYLSDNLDPVILTI